MSRTEDLCIKFFKSSSLKHELIPNFQLLDHAVQKEIMNILDYLTTGVPTKKKIQQCCRLGLLEEAPLLRSHMWKSLLVMLQTLSLDCSTWQTTKQSNHELYRTLADKFLGKYLDDDDLLDLKDQNFDQNMWHEIELDTKRTHSVLNFFQKEIDHTRLYLGKKTRNCDILSRILYVWGKINPTVRYVQGMNQILAPLYYLEFQKNTIYAQSQVFFMFASLMTFLMDMHIKDMDNSEQGILGKINTLNKYLKVVDLQLWRRLEEEKVNPQFYSFRWLSLLLAQEFNLYQTMKVWDLLLSYDGYKRFFMLYCICIGILKYHKMFIMQNDFISILPTIQKLKDVDIVKIMEIGSKLYDKYSRVNVENLYNQINEQLTLRKDPKHQVSKAQQFANQMTELGVEGSAEKEGKWNYSSVLKNTSQFFFKMMSKK